MEVRPVGSDDRAWVEEVLVRRWGSTDIASCRGTHAAAALPALLAEVDGERVGLLTHHEADGQLEVVTLDALVGSIGVGTALLYRARELASEHGCSRVWLVTSNDNLRALRFYQRRGFHLVALHVGGVDTARAIKPAIPTVGLDDIPVHDEIELACELGSSTIADPDRTGVAAAGGEVVLVPVAEEDKAVLANLLQLYRYDFSPIRGFELTEHGTYVYRFLDAYFTEPDRQAWFIRHAGRLAGFAMARLMPDGRNEVTEFFVVRAHRRSGVGRRAAESLFQQRPGRWEVAYDVANREAAGFWPPAVAAAARGPVEHREEAPPDRTYRQLVLRFSTR